jgi:Putative transposase, YhgA-like
MEKQTNTPASGDPLDIRYFLHQPHEKFVRSLPQYRFSAMQIIEYALDRETFDLIDLESLDLSNSSFIDEKLKISLAEHGKNRQLSLPAGNRHAETLFH